MGAALLGAAASIVEDIVCSLPWKIQEILRAYIMLAEQYGFDAKLASVIMLLDTDNMNIFINDFVMSRVRASDNPSKAAMGMICRGGSLGKARWGRGL